MRPAAAAGPDQRLNDCAEFENREIHGDHEPADDRAEEDHDDRLQELRKSCDCVVDFLFEEIRHFAQHAVELPAQPPRRWQRPQRCIRFAQEFESRGWP